MTSTLGPYKVGEELIATCITSAGKLIFYLKSLKKASKKFLKASKKSEEITQMLLVFCQQMTEQNAKERLHFIAIIFIPVQGALFPLLCTLFVNRENNK